MIVTKITVREVCDNDNCERIALYVILDVPGGPDETHVCHICYLKLCQKKGE